MPKVLDGLNVGALECCDSLIIYGSNEFCLVLRVGILVLDFKKLHGTDHGLHGHEDILKDQLDESSFVLIRITGSVNDAHLFDKGRLAGLSGP